MPWSEAVRGRQAGVAAGVERGEYKAGAQVIAMSAQIATGRVTWAELVTHRRRTRRSPGLPGRPGEAVTAVTRPGGAGWPGRGSGRRVGASPQPCPDRAQPPAPREEMSTETGTTSVTDGLSSKTGRPVPRIRQAVRSAPAAFILPSGLRRLAEVVEALRRAGPAVTNEQPVLGTLYGPSRRSGYRLGKRSTASHLPPRSARSGSHRPPPVR